MKILQRSQKYFAMIRFSPNQQRNNNITFKVVQAWQIALAVFGTSLVGLYIFRIADSKEEYMYSAFTLTAVIGIAVSYASMMFKNDKIYDAIELGEKLLTERGEFQSCINHLLYYFLKTRKYN